MSGTIMKQFNTNAPTRSCASTAWPADAPGTLHPDNNTIRCPGSARGLRGPRGRGPIRHHLAHHGGKRGRDHPHIWQVRVIHGRLGGRHRADHRRDGPDPRVCGTGHLHRQHNRQLYADQALRRPGQRRKARLHRQLGRRAVGIDGPCVRGGLEHGIQRNRRPGPFGPDGPPVHVLLGLVL